MPTRWACLPLILVLLALAACASSQPTPAAAPPAGEPVTIRFAVQAGDAPVTCARGAEALGSAQNAVQFNDLRFYVSNVALVSESGEAARPNWRRMACGSPA